ncbi:hypothetical protein PPTG_22292 [Phytophthora nicotianae INRA-310]|uniref:Uncharacterized protein n=3 Tax=Phytophthora nicotianae TaxID=4792 RepID=W2QP32_PHYN3|nr:hypothetical protein PPTG_22292 [Phytophthora nicotianae INRA-310]ETI53146.1 hypothetical protein F443_03860 [Phytophthora nicotianae P1569]ETL46424.1 hypothetical protein L916_03683 [Phytophthora nicotianae]ETM52711.1 hypothetical protein L914_03707 [Phytophthora nicotianae]ETN14015.1 hypothetical protein PPTG_22292 [Phytophthora nicotianae INRA-310]
MMQKSAGATFGLAFGHKIAGTRCTSLNLARSVPVVGPWSEESVVVMGDAIRVKAERVSVILKHASPPK